MEVNEILLPELLSVDWAPSEGLLVNFLSELINGREDFVVLVQVIKELFKKIVNILIYPMPVLELGDDLNCIDIGLNFQANFVIFQVLF